MINTEAINILEESKKFGFDKIEGYVTLIGKTPHIAPEAWFHEIYDGLNLESLDLLEKSLNIKIRDSYRKFLLKNNGMNLFSGSLSLFGYRYNYSRSGKSIWQPFDLLVPNVLERLKDANDSFLFFGSYNWDGSLLYFNDEDLVVRCLRTSIEPINTWNSLSDFLNDEICRLNKHFESGIELNEDNPTIPVIVPS